MRRGSFAKILALLVAALTLLTACKLDLGGSSAGHAAGPAGASVPPIVIATAAPAADWAAASQNNIPITYPNGGSGNWDVSPGQSAVAGTGGTFLRFQVVVEREVTGLDRSLFGNEVFAALADPRSWTAGGKWRLQRVGEGQQHNFTIYLATPITRDRLCGVTNDRYTSCRMGDQVVLNVARWVHGVPHFGAGIDVYRQYMVNHEVGHRLGQGHELCPGAGKPAPIMQQQTLGLHGCLANAWPYINNVRYVGPVGAYDDPVPAA